MYKIVLLFIFSLCSSLSNAAVSIDSALLENSNKRAMQAQQIRLAGEALALTQKREDKQQSIVKQRQEIAERAQGELGTLQALAMANPDISTEPARKKYARAKRSLEAAEYKMIDLRIQHSEELGILRQEKIRMAGLEQEKKRLEQELSRAHYAALQQQIERVRVVSVRGEYSCGDSSIRVCKQQALIQAKRNAAEQGSAVMLDSITNVQDSQITRDEISLRVHAILLEHEVLAKGMLGETGYFYRIRATVKGQMPEYQDATVSISGVRDSEFSEQKRTVGKERVFDGISFVWIVAGEFMMGAPLSELERRYDEQQHRVTIAQGFWLGKYEVTQLQWQTVMGSNPSHFKGDNLPVDSVSWNDIQGYLKRLGSRYRLPTEAEWEYAARAGTTTPFSTGRCISTDQNNYDGNYPYARCSKGEYRRKTLPVGALAKNNWGLYDIHGNVWEWTSSLYKTFYDGSELKGSYTANNAARSLRGGSWVNSADWLRSSFRNSSMPANRNSIMGFRVVRTVLHQEH